jgi:hypothetical protein
MSTLHPAILLFHSIVRYFVLFALIASIIRGLRGWTGAQPFTKTDEKLSVWLMIMAHTQLLLGFALYFISPVVIFSAASMKDNVTRYWLVEHVFTMVLAILMITLARITTKKLTDDVAKHKRIFIYNTIALLLILMAISMSGRGFFSLPQ